LFYVVLLGIRAFGYMRFSVEALFGIRAFGYTRLWVRKPCTCIDYLGIIWGLFMYIYGLYYID
jgi:hypothetical protein